MLLRMSKGGDSSLEAMLNYGEISVDKDGFTDVQYTKAGGKQGFATIMAPLNGEHDRFLLHLAALRAENLKAVGLENNFSDQDIATLKTLDQGTMADGTSRKKAYAEARLGVNRFNDSVLKIASDSGLIDEATRQLYKDTPYVPFYRLQDDGIVGFGMKGGVVNQTAWKSLKGGTAKLNEDLLSNMLQNWSHLITASAKNRAAKATLEAAVAKGIADEVPSGTPGKGLVSFRDGGKDRTFRVSDPLVMDAISALEYKGLGPWAKPLVAMKMALTRGVTVSPTFKARILIRDALQAVMNDDLSYNPVENIVKGWAATADDSETRAHLMASGGMIRFGMGGDGSDHARSMIHKFGDNDVMLGDHNAVQKLWNGVIKPVFEEYEDLGSRGEQVSRAALYDRLIAKGVSHGEASFWARDLMDYSSRGKWTAVRTIAQTVPFFNAHLQGIYKMGRSAMRDPARFTTVAGSLALASVGLMLAYKDDDDFNKREDFDRRQNWWFKIGNTAYRIPKPFELGSIATIAEMGTEYFASKAMDGKRFTSNLSDMILGDLAMNPTPQLFKPMMDLYANRDSFTHRPIETDAMTKMQAQDRFTNQTSEVGRFLGSLGLPDPTQLVMAQKYSPLSPVQVDSLTRGYFNWFGSTVLTASDLALRPALGRGPRPAMTVNDIPVASSFVKTVPDNASRYVTQMYERAQEIQQAHGSLQDAIKSGNLPAALQIQRDNKDLLAQYPALEHVTKEEARISAAMLQIQNSTSLGAAQKRVMLDQLSAQRDRVARTVSGP